MSAQPGVPSLDRLVVIDDEYDRSRASDGFSRYGAYLTKRLRVVVDHDPDVLTDPVRWAAFAWCTATGPVMSPGYVDWNGPIDDIEVSWDEGHMLLEAVVRTNLPVPLWGWSSWEQDSRGRLHEPRFTTRAALARVIFRSRLIDLRLPKPPRACCSQQDVVTAGKRSVAAIAAAATDLLVPAVAVLQDLRPRRVAAALSR